jgi:hypothetical protein
VLVLALLAGLGAGAVQGPTSRSFDGEDGACPDAEAVEVEASVRVTTADGALGSRAELVVRADGITPARAPYPSLELEYSPFLLDCLVGTSHPVTLREVDWDDGEATFVLRVGNGDLVFDEPTTGDPGPFPDGPPAPVALDLSGQDAQVLVTLCPTGPDAPETLVCSASVAGTLEVALDEGVGRDPAVLDRVTARPAPTRALVADDGSRRYRWAFSGAPPTVGLEFATTWTQRAVTYLGSRSAGDVVLVDGDAWSARLDVRFLGYAGSALVALFVSTVVIRRAAALRVSASVIMAILAFGALRVQVHTSSYGAGAAVVAAASWTVIALLAVRVRDRRAVVLLRAGAALIGFVALVGTGAWLVARAADPAEFPPVHDPVGSVLLVVGLLGLTLLGSWSIGSRLLGTVELLPDDPDGVQRGLRGAAVVGFTSAALFAVAFPFGTLLSPELPAARDGLTDLTGEVATASSAIGSTVVSLAFLLVVALVADRVRSAAARGDASRLPRDLVGVLALALAVSTSWGASGAALFGLSLPLWVVTWLVVRAAFLWWHRRSGDRPPADEQLDLQRALAAETRRAELVALDRQVDGVTVTVDVLERARDEARTLFPDDPTRRYLERGTGGAWLANGQRAALLGTALAIVPVGYFLWTTLTVVGDRLTWSSGLLFLMISVSLEGTRWLVVAFCFGALHRLLPGRTGLTKSFALSAVWLAATLAGELTSRALGAGGDQLWLYRSLQLVVFLIALAVAYDLMTVRDGGGGWRQLRRLYSVESYTDLTGTTVPVVLAVVALGQQLVTGSGADVAEAFLSGLGSIFGR